MLNTCKLCGNQFEAKVYNNYICDKPHYINCRICGKPVYMNGDKNKKKRKMYFDKGYVYCSHECSCKGVGIDKYNKANLNVDLNRLEYLKTQTATTDTEIAQILGVSIGFVVDRCKRNNWIKPEELKTELDRNKNKNISKSLKQKYSNDIAKHNMLQRACETYKAKTGYEHNFKNPEEIERYKRIKLEKYGNMNFTNPKKMVQTRKSNNNGKFWNEEQLKKLSKSQNKSRAQIDLITTKRSETKLARYGDANYNNSEKISETLLSKTQQEKHQIVLKAKNTKLLKYNNPNYNNSEKRINTCVNKYRVNNPDYRHFSQDNYNIIISPTNFRKFLNDIPYEKRTTQKCMSILGMSQSGFNSLYHKYNCEDIAINQFNSKFEQEVKRFIDEIYKGKIIYNARNVITPYELDIYMPENNLAIECNGTYWHSLAMKPDKQYHYNKSKLCEEKGIRLIHIFEYEWYNPRQRPILENIIKNALNVNLKHIYARKLSVEVYPTKQLKSFFDKNNIQGFRGGKFAICLTDKNTKEVYMSYIMGHPFFGKGKYQWEVIRGATKLGCTVVGGASKIFNYFVKTYNPQNCVYYIDYNYFNGNSLKYLPHMKFIKTQPSFKNWWVASNEIKNRDPMHHKEIKTLEAQGLIIPIYNAGTKVYVWERE